MKKICKPLIEVIAERRNFEIRKTVRGIIRKDGKILLVYSKKFDDYMFPGGHMKKEKKRDALRRELKEEVGCNGIEILGYYGRIIEKRYSNKDNVLVKQISYYYLCDIDEIGEQALEEDEIKYGVKPIWIKIDDAIKHNESAMLNIKHQQAGLRTVLKREVMVLKKLRGEK